MTANSVKRPGWQFWIDRGGTFTDVIARDPGGHLHSHKLLSEQPSKYADAAVAGVQQILTDQSAHAAAIESIKMGTTVATNALLERRGEPTVFLTTAGFADILRIGTQQRPDIFALDIELPQMLYSRVIEAEERISAGGEVVCRLNEKKLHSELTAAAAKGFRSIAIAFLHGYTNGVHERRAAAIARDVGFTQVSVSHEVSPTIKIVPRGDTTLVDAYLTPVLRRYVDSVRAGLADITDGASLQFMQSHGGLTDAASFRGKDSILSGPAGGVVGMVKTAGAAGYQRIIGFDMGGTSTDVTLFNGAYERTTETTIAGVRITAPMLDIHTVAAGGGSIIQFLAGRIQVGPESAGADPGPVAYRNNGPLTLTDANVLLGRIQADYFPAIFGPTHDAPLDTALVRSKFQALADAVNAATESNNSAESLAAGALTIGIEHMAQAVKQISIQRGIDLGAYTLCCFGGAGGQHACAVADALGIRTVFIHSLAGLLSAFGMGVADERFIKRQTIEAKLCNSSLPGIAGVADTLAAELAAQQTAAPAAGSSRRIEMRINVKVAGTDTTFAIRYEPEASFEALTKRFSTAHSQHFGFEASAHELIVDSLETELIIERDSPAFDLPACDDQTSVSSDYKTVWFSGKAVQTPIYERSRLQVDFSIAGPALIVEENSTTVLEPGWKGHLDHAKNLILTRVGSRGHTRQTITTNEGADAVKLEIFNNAFMHVAEQMGIVLQATAHSVNIKERMDFSCAVFDRCGELIANAPHVPVHLGSMGDTVQAVLAAQEGSLRKGCAYMSNAPYQGGTHLPDITVVTPVSLGPHDTIDFIVASRAHHADVGGITPGSMPPFSQSIHDEGAMFESVCIVRDNRFAEAAARSALTNTRIPARNPNRNIADLRAQIAANARGATELARLVNRYGGDECKRYVSFMKKNAASAVRQAITGLDDGSATVKLDNGLAISVNVAIDRDTGTAVVDFSGTSATSTGNLNAPLAVARSAVLYVFRTLVQQAIPLNAGCLEPLKLIVPEDCLINPQPPAAVVGGNVETSQRIVDALMLALGKLASSQGTMNNLTFGNSQYQYYETICGGAGASVNAAGASAVHTHMTNSRLTDPEVLETRYPVRIRRFQIRTGSGGLGKHNGGDGVIRDIEFLEDMTAAILSNCRKVPPHGILGGGDGLCGSNYVIASNNTAAEPLGGIAQRDMHTGDRLIIETPGGGGYGAR